MAIHCHSVLEGAGNFEGGVKMPPRIGRTKSPPKLSLLGRLGRPQGEAPGYTENPDKSYSGGNRLLRPESSNWWPGSVHRCWLRTTIRRSRRKGGPVRPIKSPMS